MSDQSEFSYKMTGLSYTANDNDEVTISSEWEGTATGFGAVFGTLRATMALTDANAASGPCTFVGGAAPDDGSLVLGIGEGIWERFDWRQLALVRADRTRHGEWIICAELIGRAIAMVAYRDLLATRNDFDHRGPTQH